MGARGDGAGSVAAVLLEGAEQERPLVRCSTRIPLWDAASSRGGGKALPPLLCREQIAVCFPSAG